MQEYTAVTAPTASGLADALNQHAADGWSVVQVVTAGHEIAAILSREAVVAAEPTLATVAEPVAEPGIEEPVIEEPAAQEPVLADSAATFGLGAMAASTAVDEPAGWAAAPDDTGTVEPTLPSTQPTAAAPAAEPAPAPAPAPAAQPAVPSGWYADPSGRFELRYWDGSQWTEHVSRAGQQYTDPPVA